jgi:hypothetical protein
MLRKVSYALVVTAILLVAAVPSVIAQYDFAMSVGINLANLDPNNGANIGVTYYPVNTATAPTTISDSIPAGGATKYFPIPVSDGFTGSVVISSDTQIAAIVNEISSGYSGSYNGFSEGNTSFYAPIIMRANGGYDTEISVQNAGSGTASVGIEFVAGTSGTDYTMPDFDVEEGRAVRVYQGTQTQLGTKFVGAATITADKPVVVIVNQINNTAKTLLVYGGFPSGSNRVAVAQVQHNNADYNTGIQVQNVHATNPATVTVTYGPNAKPGGTAFTPGVETAYVMPGETAVFNQWGNNHGYDWNSAPAYVGAAIVSSTQGNVPLVVNVNVLKGTAPAQASAYEGLDADAPSTNFSAPVLMSNNGGFSTSCLVLNTASSGDPINVVMSFTPNAAAGITFQPDDESFELAPGASNQFRQFPTIGQWASDNGGARWLGSGEIQAEGPIAVVCNQLNFNATSSDGLMSYSAFPLD